MLCEDGIDLVEQRVLFGVGEERGADRGPREFGDTGRVETKELRGDVVLTHQCGVEHRRIVRGDGDRYSGLAKPPHRMLGERAHRPGPQVRRRAHLQRNLIGC
jgi:hypothetical protein